MNKLFLIVGIITWGYFSSFGQTERTFSFDLKWNQTSSGPSFEGALQERQDRLPVFIEKFDLTHGNDISARIANPVFESITISPQIETKNIPTTIQINSGVEKNRKKNVGFAYFVPLIYQGGELKKLVKFDLVILEKNKGISPATVFNRDPGTISNLADGDIYKMSVSETGIHKLDYDFFKDNLGISDMSSIDPRNIQILGNGGGKLPGSIDLFRPDDVMENRILFIGEADGRFDPGDFILFYAEGPDVWNYSTENDAYEFDNNIYDKNNYYFVKIGSSTGKRVQIAPSTSGATYTTETFDDYQYWEDDRYNVLNDYSFASGSGRNWFGEKFDLVKTKTYNFNFPQMDISQPIEFDILLAGRSNTSSLFTATINGENFQSTVISGTNLEDVERIFANLGSVKGSTSVSTGNISVTIDYPAAGAEGWLDYIRLIARSNLSLSGKNQLIFRDKRTLDAPVSKFQLNGGTSNTKIWNITTPWAATEMTTQVSGGNLAFETETNTFKEFIAFQQDADFPRPNSLGEIENQNLHAINNVDAVFIYPKVFEAAAQRLAEHRTAHSGISVALAPIEDVFNEFSSGSFDPTAIRDFVKMIYNRHPDYKYLLLLGDGSFDYKNIYELEVETNTNYIPVYETVESLDPINSFPSDDYYALLSEGEGGSLVGALDIAVGRIPARSAPELDAIIDKIIRYDSSPVTLGDWRLSLAFAADDEDTNLHINQADRIAVKTDTIYDDFNLSKIYFDAFQQVASAGSQAYPDAKTAINGAIFKGQLAVNYLGHGGPTGWAQERVLQDTDITGWTNKDKLPLFITATCSFGPYDDASRVSVGELLINKGDGGAIALYTTTRAVYSSSNERLTKATFDFLFEPLADGSYPTIGEIMRLAKNFNSADTTSNNSRKFTLLGDPTMHLAIPEHDVITTSINGVPVTGSDTLSALQQVTIEGIVANNSGTLLSDFNGTVFTTIFDKEQISSTLVNDPTSKPKDFSQLKNIIFKGAATVTNGRFSISFVVPKDIDYNFGFGKISHYAHDGISRDAGGNYEGIVVGGTSENAIADDTPPVVDVFMNTEDFAFGGITDADPVLLVKLEDDFGINVSGTSIGHDLTAVIDENGSNTIVLNDFYEAEVDDYRKGKVNFPLNNLEQGRHSIRIKAWDIANNSGEGYTEFIVAEDAEIALDHVLNYPNPFSTNTEFQFEHNMAGQLLRVQIGIYTVSGRLVKTIEQEVLADGYRITGIQWNGRDDFGDELARGVYLYKISLGVVGEAGISNSKESHFEKLVILK